MNIIENRILDFLDSSISDDELFPGSGYSIFGKLFREYIYITLRPNWDLNTQLCGTIENHLKMLERSFSFDELAYNKSYLQLLCFYLSYRNFFSQFNWDSQITKSITKIPVKQYLTAIGAHKGVPGSGNFSMFIAILIYNESRDRNDSRLVEWFDFMDSSMNKYGLWGTNHFIYQMQNGYHQYEIYKFFDHKQPIRFDVDELISHQDSLGHFGPFMGGGACYDFDATDLLIQHGEKDQISPCLIRLALNLELEQNLDGGFCESPYIQRSMGSVPRLFVYTLDNFNIPRLKSFLKLFINYNRFNKIPTHWSSNHRYYNDSDLWGTWFRLLTLRKINSLLEETKDDSRIFTYPGIGF